MRGKCTGLAVLAVVTAFLCGYTGSGPHAWAVVKAPPACPMYECKTVAAYWAGNAGFAWGVYTKVTDSPSSDGYENIFTPQSNENKPRNPDGNVVRHWQYDSCTPWCGRDANLVWQAPQEVFIPDTATRITVAIERNRTPCTAANGQGNQVANPTNGNTGQNIPPGWGG